LLGVTLRAEVFDGKDEATMSYHMKMSEYYNCLYNWNIRYRSLLRPTAPTITRDIDHIGDDVLKCVVARIVNFDTRRHFASLPICEHGGERGNFRFYERNLAEILDMDTGASVEEFIAVAAIYAKKLFVLPRAHAPTDDTTRRRKLRYEAEEWVQAFGTSADDPYMTTFMTWSEAAQYVADGSAIAISDVVYNDRGHVDAVCATEVPCYMSTTQLDTFENAGYMLRSLSNVPYSDDTLFAYALMLACAPMSPQFRYCCTLVDYAEFQNWMDDMRSKYLEWWCSPKNTTSIVSMHAAFTLSSDLVYHGGASRDDGDIRLDDGLYLAVASMRALTIEQLCTMWETAVVFARILGKVIFVVRDSDHIVGYGGGGGGGGAHSDRFVATWSRVITSLTEARAVCCFTSTTTTTTRNDDDNNDFDITHVLLPASSCIAADGSGRGRGSGNTLPTFKSSSYYYGGRTTTNHTGACALEEFDNSHRCCQRVVTLAEADELMNTSTFTH
jgi:hypothetical protein